MQARPFNHSFTGCAYLTTIQAVLLKHEQESRIVAGRALVHSLFMLAGGIHLLEASSAICAIDISVFLPRPKNNEIFCSLCGTGVCVCKQVLLFPSDSGEVLSSGDVKWFYMMRDWCSTDFLRVLDGCCLARPSWSKWEYWNGVLIRCKWLGWASVEKVLGSAKTYCLQMIFVCPRGFP